MTAATQLALLEENGKSYVSVMGNDGRFHMIDLDTFHIVLSLESTEKFVNFRCQKTNPKILSVLLSNGNVRLYDFTLLM